MVATVSTTDADEGQHGEVSYDFSGISDKATKLFSIQKDTGDIRVIGLIDFELETYYEMLIQAKDGSGLVSMTKVIVEITVRNYNAPVIFLNL